MRCRMVLTEDRWRAVEAEVKEVGRNDAMESEVPILGVWDFLL